MTKSSDLGPIFSLAELALSWAGVTGDTPERILYRLGDWAMTDVFPDDAFLTDKVGDATFNKTVIFERMLWHQNLLNRIHEERDLKERKRLQKFADSHMQVAEITILRRDVVVEACRVMDVKPPPILGLVEGVSARHVVPPECPVDWPVGVFARQAEQDQKHHRGDIMSPDEAQRCTLLWDLAAERSRSNGRSVEWNWLRLMDRFWEGDLSPNGLVYFYPGLPGRESVVFEHMALARLLLGHRAGDGTVPVENLRNWTMADYLAQPSPYCDYFRCDPQGRVGLAIRTDELKRRRGGTISGTEMSTTTGTAGQAKLSKRRRGAYFGALERFIARVRPEVLAQMSDHGISIQFEDECRNLLNAGKSVPALPCDRRNIERQVSKIRERISTAVPRADSNAP